MENTPLNFGEKENGPGLKNDRTVLYMGIILGCVILIMTYVTLFIDDPSGIFRAKEETLNPVKNQALLLNNGGSMSNEDIHESLIKFIDAFYYDQKKGYFDPPSYFAPITKTFYNFHNLTYDRLRELYWKRMQDMRRLERSWIPGTLEFIRTDSGIVANYWTKEKYFRPSIRQVQSADVKYEIIIDENGKIFSLREAEIQNFQTYVTAWDTTAYSPPVKAETKYTAINPVNKDQKTYDVSVVDVVPQFQGGANQLAKFFQTNLRYPASAREKKIQGNVYISFFVEKDGTLRNIEVRQGLGSGCDEEAVRVVRSFPPWTPGMLKGDPVSTFYILPVPFQLN
jgi:TonB family protein